MAANWEPLLYACSFIHIKTILNVLPYNWVWDHVITYVDLEHSNVAKNVYIFIHILTDKVTQVTFYHTRATLCHNAQKL